MIYFKGKITDIDSPSSPYGKIGDSIVICVSSMNSISLKLQNWNTMTVSPAPFINYYHSVNHWSFQNTATQWRMDGSDIYILSESSGTTIKGSVEMIDVISLKSLGNSRYISVDNSGTNILIANKDTVGLWELFSLSCVSTNKITLQSLANNKYVCAESTGSGFLVANRDVAKTWEEYGITLLNNNQIRFQSCANNKYVRVCSQGPAQLIADNQNPGPSETYVMIGAAQDVFKSETQVRPAKVTGLEIA